MIARLPLSAFDDFYKAHFERDFPKNELPPRAYMRSLVSGGAMETLVHTSDDGQKDGYAVICRDADDLLLFLFAVEPECRGDGVGSGFMRELFDLYSDARGIIIEVEKPEIASEPTVRELRERRMTFYDRLGYRLERTIDYEIMGVPMWLLSRTLAGPAYTAAELAEAILRIYSRSPDVLVRAEVCPDVIIRPLGLSECGRIREIDASQYIAKAWRDPDGNGLRLINIDWFEPDFPNEYANHLAGLRGALESGGAAFGAFLGGTLAGFCSLKPDFFGEKRRYLLLDQLFITRPLRGQGLGKRLFLAAADEAKRRGANALYVCSASAENTVAFYRHVGCADAAEINSVLYSADPRDPQLEFGLDNAR